jgi:superfamily II DNA or RNA helicase
MVDVPRFGPGDTVRIRAERWVVNAILAASSSKASEGKDVMMLDVRGVDTGNGGQRARFLLPFEPIEPLGRPGIPKVIRPTEWRATARRALADATPFPDSLRVAPRARFDVMPYQIEPALAVTGGHGCRLLIADEVGLGKTVQAGLIVAELLERHPDAHALVICPAGLREQWRQELQRRFDLTALVVDSAGLTRVASNSDVTVNPWTVSPLSIVSIDFIKRPEVMRALEGLVWDVVVLDEAHHLAGRSDRSTAAAVIGWRARTLVMLSATPHSGDDVAFARLCSTGDVRNRFPLLLFRRTRRDAGIPVERRTSWLHVRPTAAEARMHAALVTYATRVWHERRVSEGARLAMTVLLRRASSSAESLVRSLERRLAALTDTAADHETQLALPWAIGQDDEEPAGAVLTPGLSDSREERRLIDQLLGLARVAALRESKLDALRRWMSRVHEPVLVFTEYRDTLQHLRQALVRSGIDDLRIVELHGGLVRSERESAGRRFVDGRADILIATDAASEGLNLHHRCRCVVNLEIPWTPVRLEQRIGRVDRIGQRRRVHAVNLVAAETYELTTVRRLIDRAQKAAGALRDTAPSNEATSSAILTGVDVPESSAGAALPSSIRQLDLSERATAEAARIIRARQLAPGPFVMRSRPVTTILSRTPGRLILAFELTILDRGGLPVWTTIVGTTGALSNPRHRHGLQQAIAAATDQALTVTDAAATRLLSMTAATLQPGIVAATAREEAIAGAVRLRHARIAADLLQPGLFDRRAERRAAAQTAVLEEALGRCHLRLEALARLADLCVDCPSLRFAAFLR